MQWQVTIKTPKGALVLGGHGEASSSISGGCQIVALGRADQTIDAKPDFVDTEICPRQYLAMTQ